MPTKFLVLETPNFQIGANAGDAAEKLDPAAFPARLQKHFSEGKGDMLFVLAPEEVRYQGVFTEAAQGPGSVSTAFFPRTEDCIRFLPSLLLFANEKRSLGVKDCLQKGSSVFSETFFNGNSVGSKLDPTFAFARRHLTGSAATSAWGCIQSLVFHGLQNLPDQGEKGSGEKVDVQIGADDKILAITVRFDLAPEKAALVKSSPVVALARASAGVYEARYIADAKKMEFNCLFFRVSGPQRSIEISTFQASSAQEDASVVKDYHFKSFGGLSSAMPEEKRVIAPSKGGFKKKFSAQISPDGPAAPEAISSVSSDTAPYAQKLTVSGGASLGEDATLVKGAAPLGVDATLVKGSAPIAETSTLVTGKFTEAEKTTTVSNNGVKYGEKETIFKGGDTNAELETRIKGMEITLQQKEQMIAKLNKDLAALSDPASKRDVITNIKDSQSEGLKQNIKVLEGELGEAKEREKELMKMVDKAVQMKDEAAKKIKELDLKLKQVGGNKGSKEQQLEKQLDEQKRQNKELAARVGELMAKQRGGKAA